MHCHKSMKKKNCIPSFIVRTFRSDSALCRIRQAFTIHIAEILSFPIRMQFFFIVVSGIKTPSYRILVNVEEKIATKIWNENKRKWIRQTRSLQSIENNEKIHTYIVCAVATMNRWRWYYSTTQTHTHTRIFFLSNKI